MRRILIILMALLLSLSACSTGLARMDSMLIMDVGYGLTWQGRDYIPYCTVSAEDCTEQVGYVDKDKDSEVYQYKDYSEKEWLVWVQEDGVCLLKERGVFAIPEGLEPSFASEYV